MSQRYLQIAGAEVRNPRRSIPKAIRSVYVRIVLFYIGGVTIIGLLVPSNDRGLSLGDGTAAASPFVIAITNAGIKILPSVRGSIRSAFPLRNATEGADHQCCHTDLGLVRGQQRPIHKLTSAL